VKTIWFLLKIIVPVTFAVALLDWLGALSWIARVLAPVMAILGLPGEAALVFISSVFLNIYSAIAVAYSMSLDMRSVTILAIMCLTAHNLIVETAVMKKTGSSSLKMALLRIGSAFVAGYAFHLLLPASLAGQHLSSSAGGARPDFPGMLGAWGLSTLKLSIKIVLIVLAVMIAQRLLEEFKAMDLLSRVFAPVMGLLGLPRESSFLWIVINVVGYAYGAGIVEEQVRSGRIKPQDADLFNHHAGLCHSLLEDTVLFLAVGAPLFWITVPRLCLAILAVWLERARRRFFRHSFRVGTT
jgi:spore maturation protein SpmB